MIMTNLLIIYRFVHLFLCFIDFVFSLVYPFFETLYAFSQTAHQFRNFLTAKQQQDNQCDDNPFGTAGQETCR